MSQISKLFLESRFYQAYKDMGGNQSKIAGIMQPNYAYSMDISSIRQKIIAPVTKAFNIKIEVVPTKQLQLGSKRVCCYLNCYHMACPVMYMYIYETLPKELFICH